MGASTETPPPRPAVLAFHKLLPRLTYGVTNYSPDRFLRLIERLRRAGWRPAASADREAGERDYQITFDDGYQHLAETLPPLVERYDLRPIIFMPTALIGADNRWDYSHRFCPTRHLDESSIRRLADLGLEFGSHGRAHRDLTGLGDRDLEAELADSRKQLQDLTGQPVESISYPFGRCDARVRAMAEQAGYRRGYTMAFPSPDDSPLALGRLPVYGFDTAWSMEQKLARGWAYPIERLKAEIVSRLSGGTVLLNRLRPAPDRSLASAPD